MAVGTTGIVAERTQWPSGSGEEAREPRRRPGWLLDEDDRRSASNTVIQSYAKRLGPNPVLVDASDRELDHCIGQMAAEIAAATCRWMELLAEGVIRGLWADQGAKTPAEWLSWRCGLSPVTAREHVRVALRLRELPATRDRFAAGLISYSKVRAITRIADPKTEKTFLAHADSTTAAGLERIISDTMRVRDTARGSQRSRRAKTGVRHRTRRDGMVEIVITLPPADATAVDNLMERLVQLDEAADRADGVEDGPTRGGRQVRAVVESLQAAVAAAPADASGEDRHLVVLHAPVEAIAAANLANDADDSAESPPREDRRVVIVRDGRQHTRAMRVATLRRLACTSNVDLAVEHHGSVHDQGRARRAPSPALRRQLLERDRGCRFPRCGSTRRLHAHHIQHWEDGGATDLANLIMLCSYHHTHVHERGWQIRPHPEHGHPALFPPKNERRTIEDTLAGASAEAVAALTREWGLELDRYSLTPKHMSGDPHDQSLTVELLFHEIVAANRLATIPADDSAESANGAAGSGAS